MRLSQNYIEVIKFRKKLKFLAKIKRVLGEQKIDVVFNLDSDRLIEKEAKQWGVKL